MDPPRPHARLRCVTEPVPQSSAQGDDDHGHGDPFSVSFVAGGIDRSPGTGEAAEVEPDCVVGRSGLGRQSPPDAGATLPFEEYLHR